MKRKLLSVFLALSLCAGLIPTAALAAGDAPGCTCETACAEGAINADCPVCGVENADLSLCAGRETDEQVKAVQSQIGALPSLEDVQAMSPEEQQEAYGNIQAAYDAYNALTDEQKAQITGAELLDSLFDYFNSMTNAIAEPVDYRYYESGEWKTGKVSDYTLVTSSMSTAWNDEWYVVEGDATISERIVVGKGSNTTVNLILKDGSSLTASKGIEVEDEESYGGNKATLNIYAQSVGADMGKLVAISTEKLGAGIGSFDAPSGIINIYGGDITARSTGISSGIGSSNGTTSDDKGGIITIYDGMIHTTNLGGRYNASYDSGTLYVLGNPIIFADTIQDSDDTTKWSGVVFQGKSGKVYAPGEDKTITINTSFTIPEGYTLEIPEGVTLVIPEGVTVTNNGTISGGGKLTGGGQLDGSGSITVADNDFKPEAAVSVTIGGEQVQDNAAPYGSTITITAAISEAEANALTRAAADQVEFFVGTGSTKRSLGTENLYDDDNTVTKNITLTGEDWKPGTYTITAEYGGGDKLKPASGTAQFTVTKAEQTSKPTVSVSETAVDSITVSASGDGQGGYEYACVPGTNASAPSEGWTTSGTFSDLSSGTAYTVFARFAGDEYYKLSPASEGLTAYTLPEITTDTLEQAVVGVEYSETLTAQAAEGTEITWSLVSGVSLPDGLELSEDGTISGTPQEAATDHKFTVQATANGVSSTKELSITAAKGTAVIDLDAPGEETREFTYGDTITVSGTITASSQDPAANALTAPASNQAALFLGEKQLTEPVTVGANGKFTITYDTADKGIQATGQAQTLTVKYGGSDDLNAGETSFTITLNKKPVTAEVQGEITKVYDGNRKASVKLGFAAGAILSGDTVNVSAPSAAYGDEKAGTNKTITLGDLTVSGDQADFYDVKPPEGPIYGSITVSGSSLTAKAEKSELTYGDTLTITVTPKPTEQAPANTVLLDGRQGVELFYGDTSLATAAAPDENGAYTLTYDTAGKGIPIGKNITLTVQFHGDGSMAASSTTATISLSAKPVTAAVDGEIARPYNQDTEVEVKFTVAEGVEAGDTLTGKATGTFNNASVGEGKSVAVESGNVTWSNDAEWYDITLPGNITGTIEKAQIGQPSIDTTNGTKPGDTLKAAYTPTSGEEVDYQWNRGGQPIQDETAKTYTIRPEDVGQEITVTVSAQDGDDNHEGSQTSALVTPSKGTQSAPPKPEEDSVTTSSITVKEIKPNPDTGAAVEYSIDGGETWQPGTTFDKLSSGTEYTVIARYQKTDAYQASPTSEAVIRTTSPSGGDPSYSNKIEETEHGTVKVSHRTPEAGQKVTITPQPDEGYEVVSVTVTKSGNKAVEVTDNGDGTWSFKQPSGKVTIRVEFREIEPEPVELPFIDVPTDAWYIDGVRYVYEHHIMSGTSANTFNPSGIVNRGMIVQVLYNLAGQPKVEGGSGFDDVPGDFWCADAIAWASKLGVVNGYGDGTFGPNDNMTRDQMAVILFNYARAMGYDTSARGDLSGFTDIPENHWAGDALEWAYAEHLITGTSDTAMSPTGQASRAQIAVIMMRFCQRHVEK